MISKLGDSGKGQVAIEFIIMLGMAMIITTSFLAVIGSLAVDKSEADQYELFDEMDRSIQQEVLLASVAEPGYGRIFYVPPPELNSSYDRHQYSIQTIDGYVIIKTQDNTHTFPIPPVNGNIKIGKNTLRTMGGVIYANS